MNKEQVLIRPVLIKSIKYYKQKPEVKDFMFLNCLLRLTYGCHTWRAAYSEMSKL